MRWVLASCAALLAFGCGGIRDVGPVLAPGQTAVVYNAVELGLLDSVYLVVARVDGEVVHRDYDNDRGVRLAAGRHELAIRFYSEGLITSPRGDAECSLVLDAAAGAEYYLEGRAEGARWSADVRSSDGTLALPCVFADGGEQGAIRDGSLQVVLSAHPATSPARPAPTGGEEQGLAEATPVAAEAEDSAAAVVASPLVAKPAAAAPAAVVAAGATSGAVVSAAAESDREKPRAQTEVQTAAIAAAPADISGETAVGGGAAAIIGGRGRGGCGSGTFRVAAVDGETLLLSGNERVRLIGVRAFDPSGIERDLAPVVGRCVRIELDDALAPVGHRDREGRLMAYVFLVGESFLNEQVIRDGVAKVDTRRRFRYMGRLLAAQSAADRSPRD